MMTLIMMYIMASTGPPKHICVASDLNWSNVPETEKEEIFWERSSELRLKPNTERQVLELTILEFLFFKEYRSVFKFWSI